MQAPVAGVHVADLAAAGRVDGVRREEREALLLEAARVSAQRGVVGGGARQQGAQAQVDGRGGELVALALRRDAGDGGARAAAVWDGRGAELEGGG